MIVLELVLWLITAVLECTLYYIGITNVLSSTEPRK